MKSAPDSFPDDYGEPQVIETDSQLSPARSSGIEKAKPYIPPLALSLCLEDQDAIPNEKESQSEVSAPLTTRSSGVISLTDRTALNKSKGWFNSSVCSSSSRASPRKEKVVVEMRKKAVITTRKRPGKV